MHTEDLENRSQRNNVRILAVPTGAEAVDLVGYVQDLFCKILGSSSDSTIKIDRCHRVGPPASRIVPLWTSLICVHNYIVKEEILRAAHSIQPLHFRDHTPHRFQDLAASTLQKRKDFHPITNHLRSQNISYAWGHPFRLIFHLDGKLIQVSSISEACRVLKLSPDELPSPPDAAVQGSQRSRNRGPRNAWTADRLCPDPDTIFKERSAVLRSLTGTGGDLLDAND